MAIFTLNVKSETNDTAAHAPTDTGDKKENHSSSTNTNPT